MTRLLRTLHLIRADDEAALNAAAGSAADALVLDLSRVIPDTERDLARRRVHDLVPRLVAPGREVWVQVGDAQSLRTRDDVAAVAGPGLSGVCLLRTESARQVLYLEALLRDQEAAHGLEDGSLKAIPWIATAMGLDACGEIARASTRAIAIAFDADGYAADAGIERSPEGWELLYARGAFVQAARLAGIQALDGPYTGPGDQAGLVEETERVKALGFNGKFVVDPAHVDPVNLMFRPTPAQVEDARRVTAAYEEAEARGERGAVVDGRLIDALAVSRARGLLALSAAIEEKERAAAGNG